MSYPQIHSEDMIWLPRCNCFTLYARFIEIRGTVVCFYNNSRAYWMIIGHNSTIYLTYLDHREWLVGFGRRGLFTTFIEHYRTLITVTLRVTLSHTRLWQSCVPKWAVAREKGICNSQLSLSIILQLIHFSSNLGQILAQKYGRSTKSVDFTYGVLTPCTTSKMPGSGSKRRRGDLP